MSGLGSSSEDIKFNALALVEHQIAIATNKPVGVVTSTEVKKIDDDVWKKVVDHVRLHGESSVQLVCDKDYTECEGPSELPEKFYIGATLIASVTYEGNEKAFEIIRSRVTEGVFIEFINEIKRKVRVEHEALEENFEEYVPISLEKLKDDVEILRSEIEQAAIDVCRNLRKDASGELVGYITSDGKFGNLSDYFHKLDENKEKSYHAIRQGAKPVFDGEANVLSQKNEEETKEEHYLGATRVALHLVKSEMGKVKGKQYFIFDTLVPLQDYHRFLHRLRDLESEIKVLREKKDVENIYWAGKPKKKSSDVPMFGFD